MGRLGEMADQLFSVLYFSTRAGKEPEGGQPPQEMQGAQD
jgi:hypothetical protein